MFIAPQTPPRALASYVEAQWPYTYNLTVALQRRAFKKSTTICAVKDYTERQRCEPKDTTSQLNIQELHRLHTHLSRKEQLEFVQEFEVPSQLL